MKLFGYEINRSPLPAPLVKVVTTGGFRNFHGAAKDRLTADWLTSNQTADEVLRWQLPTLRARSRDLAANNDYAKKFFRLLKTNIVGPNGIRLQCRARQQRGGTLDKGGNAIIEASWAEWGKKKNASVTASLTWLELQWLIIEAVARDGECLIRKVKGYDNKFRFALQLYESDHLDINLNEDLPGGNTVKMGIEFNPWKKPIAYYLLTKHPGDASIYRNGKSYVRIPAEEMLHIFVKERESQSRGVPWLHTAIIRLRMIGAYEEAELVAARFGASKMGFFVSQDGTSAEEYQGDAKDKNGNLISEIESGTMEKLPYGVDFKPLDFNHPSGNFQPFLKAVLRGASAGIGVAYNNFANDLEGVNYSSIRQGALDERDGYKVIQNWMSESVHDEIYPDWLQMGLLTQAIPLPAEKFDKFNSVLWQPRRWGWVDPLKDVQANTEAIKFGLTSRTKILAEQGEDFEEIIEDLKREQEALKAAGIAMPADTVSPQDNQENNNNDQADSAEKSLEIFRTVVAELSKKKEQPISVNINSEPMDINIKMEAPERAAVEKVEQPIVVNVNSEPMDINIKLEAPERGAVTKKMVLSKDENGKYTGTVTEG